jgi:hypothetical protein
MNCALTVFSESIVAMQFAVPEHPAPVQAVKTEPESAAAVRVTTVP